MTQEQIVGYFLVPFLIFMVRVTDVSMGTIRIILISRGIRYYASLIGFFEVLIWLFAIGQIMQNLDSPVHYIAYAAGFGLGNFVGITIERKLSFGVRVVRIVTHEDATELIRVLKDKEYGVTSINGEGTRGPVKMIFSVIRKGHVAEVVEIIKRLHPDAFFTVENVQYTNEKNLFPLQATKKMQRLFKRDLQKRK